MKHIYYISLLLIISSCGTPKQVIQNSFDAQKLYTEMSYSEAYTKIENVISYYESKNKNAPDTTYALAGILAVESNNISKGISYLEKAIELGNTSEDTYYTRALAYKKVDNLSKEIQALEAFTNSFPSSPKIFEIQKRLFSTYIESENLDKATNLWANIDIRKENSSELIENYLKLQTSLGEDTKTLYTLSTKLLALDPNNQTALTNIAKDYYDKAEDRYKREMDAYDKKKTRRQYAYLLEQLKIAANDYKTSAQYFEQLYKLNPSKETAAYLSNIFSRISNDKKAKYYRNRTY